VVLPSWTDVLGVVVKVLGANRIMINYHDDKQKLNRFRGKLKRRVWLKDGDIVVFSPSNFQTGSKGDIFSENDQLKPAGLAIATSLHL